MEVRITDCIDNNHQFHYWYGGDCAKIKHKGYTAYITACGDIDVDYLSGEEEDGEVTENRSRHVIASFKDKQNGGRFYDELHNCLKNDDELKKAIENGSLILNEGNWWECYIVGPDGMYIDLAWALDSDYLKDAIEEVKDHLDEMVEYIEKELN